MAVMVKAGVSEFAADAAFVKAPISVWRQRLSAQV